MLRGVLRGTLLAALAGRGRPRPLDPDHPPDLPDGPRLLVVRPDHLGDLLLCGPALARLRARLTDAEVTLLVGPWSAEVARRLPGVDRVRTVDFPWFDRQARGGPWEPYRRLARAARTLGEGDGPGYDAALLLREDDFWGAALVRRMGIPLRLGHDHPAVRPYLSHVHPGSGRAVHAVAAGLDLVAGLWGPAEPPPSPARDPLAFRLDESDRARAEVLLAPGGQSADWRPVAVHPGSGSAVKRWRAGAWGEVLRALTAPDEPVVLTGGPAERALTAAVAATAGRPTLDLAGQTDVVGLAALFARCRLVLGPDSGPLHLAVAVGTPTVHLFGPADPARFGPWGPPDRHRVVTAGCPCAPCGRLDWPASADHPCVRLIPVADVVAAARGVLTR